MKYQTLNELAKQVHLANIKWWQNFYTKQPIARNKGELIALIHSEISEWDNGEFLDLMDDKLPNRKMGEVECVDALIRILDYSVGFGYSFSERFSFNGLDSIGSMCSGFDRVSIESRQLMAIHCALSDLLEAERKNHPTTERICQICKIIRLICYYGHIKRYDIQGAFEEKMEYNRTREDHTHEARQIEGGKKF